ncbi:hypothetical protein [Sphingobacterium sp. MYb382]|uniref:hypothetical protein n=1 Tax=Sphingobacterium sp. MYb382 TaxID=2745278 RepID=UPI003095E047
MKKNIYILLAFCAFTLGGCADKDKLGEPIAINDEYQLPQLGASKADNDRILALKGTYGSYFLYNVTQKDFEWTQSSGTGSSSSIDSIVLGKPEHVGLMLDFINDIWLKYYPESFKKKGGLLYRVIMADRIQRRRPGTGFPPGQEYLFSNLKINGKGITIAGMNANLATMSKADKIVRRNDLQVALLQYYIANKLLDIPNAFYNVSDYVTVPATPVNVVNSDNQKAYRARGFLPSSYTAVGNPGEWYYGTYAWTTAKSNDLSSYLLNLTQRTDAEMAPYLKYPLIKQKFDILINHFKTKYNFDVRAMANDRY